MRGFIYTLTATMFVAIAIAVLLIVSNAYYKDYYQNTLLLKYLSLNTFDAMGIHVHSSNGTVIEEQFPLKFDLDLVESFYNSKLGDNLTLFSPVPLKFTGPINLTATENDTKVYFDGDMEITIYCDSCTNVDSNLDQGSTHYKVRVVTPSHNYTYSGYYNGKINSTSFNLRLENSHFELVGDNITATYHSTFKGTFLSNVEYSIILDNQNVHGFLNVRT